MDELGVGDEAEGAPKRIADVGPEASSWVARPPSITAQPPVFSIRSSSAPLFSPMLGNDGDNEKNLLISCNNFLKSRICGGLDYFPLYFSSFKEGVGMEPGPIF